MPFRRLGKRKLASFTNSITTKSKRTRRKDSVSSKVATFGLHDSDIDVPSDKQLASEHPDSIEHTTNDECVDFYPLVPAMNEVSLNQQLQELKAQVDDIEDDLHSSFSLSDEEMNVEIRLPCLEESPSLITTETLPISVPERGEEDKKSNATFFKQNILISILLATGPNRLKRLQYAVVRKLLENRRCSVCSTGHLGLNLPSISTFNTRIKPYIKNSVFPKNNLYMVRIKKNKAGARGGCDKYESSDSVPVALVKPSAWARLDFITPSTRKLIWGKQESIETTAFGDIENTPIVQDRKKCLTHLKLTGKERNEIKMAEGVTLEMTVDNTAKSYKYLDECGFESIRIVNKSGVDQIVLTAELSRVSYASSTATRQLRYKYGEVEHNHVDNCTVGDIVLEVKTKNQMDAIVSFRHLIHDSLDEQRISLTFCRKTKNESKCSRKKISVISIVGFNRTTTNANEECKVKHKRNQGILRDGRRYYIYRFLLYSDGFNAFQSRPGSMDGIYIIVLGIPTSKRTPATCIRKLSLCPPGTDANNMLEYIKEDIVSGTTTGITVKIGSDEGVIFLDLLGYIADAPALASTTGTKGHSANIPCHLCTMKRGNNSQTIGKFLNSRFMDSRNPSLKRFPRRIDDIFNESRMNTKKINDQLGINNHESSLSQIRKDLCEAKNKIPLSIDGSPILSGMFDEFRSSLISPDHVFLGISSCVLKILIKSFNNSQRDLLEAYVLDYLSNGNLAFQNSIMNSSRNDAATLTITEVFSITYILPYATRAVLTKDTRTKLNRDAIKRKTIQKKPKEDEGQFSDILLDLVDAWGVLINECLFEPIQGLNEEKDISFHEAEQGESRFQKMLMNTERFEEYVEKMINLDDEKGSLLDKPNLHRLRELIVHTLPMFGSLKHIQELILEKGHQQAKRSLKMSNQKNSQLQAMNDAMVEDLLCRLKSITSRMKEHGKLENEHVESIRELLQLGNDLDDVSVQEAFTEDVLFVLDAVSSPLINRDDRPYWNCPKGKVEYEVSVEKSIKEASMCLEQHVKRNLSRSNFKIEIHSVCRRYMPYGEGNLFERKQEVCAYEVIHLLTDPSKTDASSIPSYKIYAHSNKGRVEHFLCFAFISAVHDDETEIFAVCSFMKGQTMFHMGREERLYSREQDINAIVPMLPEVRKSHAIHACWTCDESPCANRNGQIFHSGSLGSGGFHVLNTNKEGYPPRRG